MILQLIDVDLEKSIYHSEKSLVVQRGGGRYTQVRVWSCTPRVWNECAGHSSDCTTEIHNI